ncbi:MAG: DNA adenine methylase [Oceanicoccus sp.]|jgi:DNA adenine methylase
MTILKLMQYTGGKNSNGAYQTIINLIPPHSTYIETHLGSGAILRLKKGATTSIGIDICPKATRSFPPQERTTIVNQDAHSFLLNFPFTGNEFVYVDPPYLISSRKSKSLYEFEYSDVQHEELLEILLNLPCNVMLSGYNSALYAEKLDDWYCTTYCTRDRSGQQVIEYLWMNYPPPTLLHDYQYLGENFRDRERIKRKHLRLKNKILDLPIREKNFLINELLKSSDTNTELLSIKIN